MLDGFAEENFSRGVPMIPKPKSEAWIICALRSNPYEGCESLESALETTPPPTLSRRNWSDYLASPRRELACSVRSRMARSIAIASE